MKFYGATKQIRKDRRLKEWHSWFAWRPVEVTRSLNQDSTYLGEDEYTAWLETVDRRLVRRYGGGRCIWEYRPEKVVC